MAGQKRRQVTGMHWKIKSAVPEEPAGGKNRQKNCHQKQNIIYLHLVIRAFTNISRSQRGGGVKKQLFRTCGKPRRWQSERAAIVVSTICMIPVGANLTDKHCVSCGFFTTEDSPCLLMWCSRCWKRGVYCISSNTALSVCKEAAL